MISCLNIPENTTAYSFIYNLALSYDKADSRTCLILPTERNLRYMSNCDFKYIEPYTISNFSEVVINTDKKILPNELRPFYLRKVISKLTNEEITAVFKSENREFLLSFIPFIQNAKNIFSFFRELFVEMVDIKNLVKAGKYSDYEKQIDILTHIWDIYLDIIHNDGWIDKYETYKEINLNTIFVDRYDNYIFLITGFLTKYEQTVFKKISEIKNVIVVFNYAGARYAQHKEYEKFFGTKNLNDKTLPVFSNKNMQIFSCTSDISQIELITKKAFEFNKKNNIPLNRMAVIMPDTSCKTYFIELDYYNLFDVSAGKDISANNFYSLMNNITSLYSQVNDDLIEISKVINMLSNDMLQQNEEVQLLTKKLDEMLGNCKLYLTKEDLLNEPFIKEYLSDFLNSTQNTTISKCISNYKHLLKSITPLFLLEEDKINEVQLLLDKLAVIYQNIDDTLLFDEASYIIFNEINTLSIDLPKKEIAVTGILESRNVDYDVLFIPYMTEEYFPPKNVKDLFINTEIRNQLNLPTFIDRDNLMKNYIYQLMSNAKITVISYSENNAGARRSSFIEELSIKNHLEELKYSPDVLSLIQDSNYYYPINTEIIVEKTDNIITQLKDFNYSASNLNTYISCSLRFYLQYILKIREKNEPVENINNMIFGTVLHSVFKTLFNKQISVKDKQYLSEFQNEFIKQMQQYDAYNHNNVEQYITSIIQNNIKQIVTAEQKHAKEGYEEINREQRIDIKFNGFKIIGIIDKIEKHKNNIVVTDYKYKDKKNIKPVLNNEFQKVDDIQMPIYALLIDNEMKKLPSDLLYFCLKDEFEYMQGFDISLYGDFKEYLADILNEIVNKDEPFRQTEKSDHCNYCPYTAVCGRENGFFAK